MYNINYLSISGILLILLYLLIILYLFNVYGKRKYESNNTLRFLFLRGLLLKLFSGIAFALIYDLYYKRGGDSFYYFLNASALGAELFKNPNDFFTVFLGFINKTDIYNLNRDFLYWPNLNDPSKIAVHRYLSLFTIIGLKNYYVTTICLNAFLYIFNWKVFLYLRKLMPNRENTVAFGILFIPSVLFWSSGILKDAFTFTFSLFFLISFHKIFFHRSLNIINLISILLSAYIVISMKPYILFAMIIGCFIWLGLSYLYRVKNKTLRVVVFPPLMIIIGVWGMFTLTSMMAAAGGFFGDVDSMLEKAVNAQQDLKQEYYKGAAFDIGNYDASVQGAVSVAPAAIVAALFRPFLWEAQSIVMVMSGIENFIILLLTIWVFIRIGLKFVVQQIFKNPFIVFCFIYTINLSIGIGLSTSNFGALVRFKIPMLPFFFMGLLLIWYEFRDSRRRNKSTIISLDPEFDIKK